MPSPSDDVSFFLQPGYERYRGRPWLVVGLAVGLDLVLDMLPNPLAGRSVISPTTLANIAAQEHLTLIGNERYLLRNLSINGQPVPDLDVQVSQAIVRLSVDGMLGLDFFTNFREVRWKPATGEVTLLVL